MPEKILPRTTADVDDELRSRREDRLLEVLTDLAYGTVPSAAACELLVDELLELLEVLSSTAQPTVAS